MFGLAPHPPLPRPSRGSPRMFKSDWVEKYFSRVKWWHVPLIWTPVALYCIWRTLQAASGTPGKVAATVALGVLAWTLLEYLLHRFLFHFEPDPKKEWQVDLSWLIHGIHHDYPWDGDRLVMPPFATLVISALLWIPITLVAGPVFNAALYAGMVFGYMAYDLTHYYLHHGVPTTALGKWLRRYHLVHHFSTPEVRYGITTPLWDHVFRTYPVDRYAGLNDQKVDELEAKG